MNRERTVSRTRRVPASTRARRVGLLALVVFAWVAGGACDGENDATEQALAELERLVFVPAGRVPAANAVVVDDVLVTAFEVTRDEWRTFLAETGLETDDVWRDKLATWTEGTGDWPASSLSCDEAERYARARGFRLPTSLEWLALAAGPQGRLYAWGDTRSDSVANTLEFGLYKPLAVGSFESGRTPAGAYDVIGNVWEWCSDTLNGLAADGSKRCAFGGSYLYFLRPIYSHAVSEYHALVLDPSSRADDVGVRLVATARDYLWRQAAKWGDGARARERLGRVGERFGAAALPLLDELARRPGAPGSLAVLAEGARR
ncbi:MAG: formylglycine-generating enzyme family protein [Planctomycetes bacterium]|nr:formylglycine-generating enzyme family protein [Planctomycetota bacterium]